MRLMYGWDPPLFSRAQRSSRGPAEIDPKLASAKTQSSDKVRGDRPPSTVEMIAGHASSVESNRPRILFEGISRSWYATAPSIQISVFSPGLRARRPTSALLQSRPLTSGIKNSSSGSSFVRMSFALRGAPCGDDSAQSSATRRAVDRGLGWAYTTGSPLFRRANPSRNGPAAICHRSPFDPIASSDRVRGDRPDLAAAMIAGHASSVDVKRPSSLVDGINLSWYSIAPSRRISVFSPGLWANGFGRVGREKSNSGISRSASSAAVGIAFALRGAPCGDDTRPWAACRDYHDQQSSQGRVADHLRPFLVGMARSPRQCRAVWTRCPSSLGRQAAPSRNGLQLRGLIENPVEKARERPGPRGCHVIEQTVERLLSRERDSGT